MSVKVWSAKVLADVCQELSEKVLTDVCQDLSEKVLADVFQELSEKVLADVFFCVNIFLEETWILFRSI